MRILFLDDDKERHARFAGANIGHVIHHVHTAQEAIEALQTNERYDVASLDHDLDEYATMGQTPRDPTGQDVVEALVSRPELRAKAPDVVVVHSFNPVGARRMAMTLRSHGLHAYLQPFKPGNRL